MPGNCSVPLDISVFQSCCERPCPGQEDMIGACLGPPPALVLQVTILKP